MKVTEKHKETLSAVLCFVLVIMGTMALLWLSVCTVDFTDTLFHGAEMTTWEQDPYIMSAEWEIAAVYLFGLYFLLPLPMRRMKRKGITSGLAAVAVISVLSLLLSLTAGLPMLLLIPFSLLAFVFIRRKYKTYCIGFATVCVSAVISIAVSYLVVYVQLPLLPDLYAYCYHSYPTRDFSRFLGYAVQPLIIAAVCGILFGIARRKEKSTENHPDEVNV